MKTKTKLTSAAIAMTAFAIVAPLMLGGCEQVLSLLNDMDVGEEDSSPPAAPSGVVATCAEEGITITWTDESDTESGFIVERRVRGEESYGAVTTLGENVTSYTDDTAPEGGWYEYRVIAATAGGQLSYSDAVEVEYARTLIVRDSEGVRIDDDGDGVALGTVAPGTQSAPIEIVFESGGTLPLSIASVAVVGESSERFAISPVSVPLVLAPGDSAQLEVVAWAGGAGLYEASVRIETNDSRDDVFDLPVSFVADAGDDGGPPPTAPSGVGATCTEEGITITWTDESDTESGFVVERRVCGEESYVAVTTLGENATSYTDEAAPEGGWYEYRVIAATAGGQLSYSDAVEVEYARTLIVRDAEGVPIGDGGDALSLGTIAPGTQSEPIEIVFESGGTLSLSIASVTVVGESSERFTISPVSFPLVLAPGDSAQLEVVASAVDGGAYAAIVRVGSNDSRDDVFDLPVSFAANYGPLVADVAVSGEAIVGEALSAAYTYGDTEGDPEGDSLFAWYRYASVGDSGGEVIAGATGATYSPTQSDVDCAIGVEVTPVADSGTSRGTPTLSDRTALVRNAAPTGLAASGSNTTVGIRWNPVATATSYSLYWSTTPGVTPETGNRIEPVASPYTHSARTNGTRYYYIVTAHSVAGEGAASSEVSATPYLPRPSAPTGLDVAASGSTNSLTWNPSATATSYVVYWSRSSSVSPSTGNRVPGISGTSYTHPNLTVGATYSYCVTAANASGEGDPSGTVSTLVTTPRGNLPGDWDGRYLSFTIGDDGDFAGEVIGGSTMPAIYFHDPDPYWDYDVYPASGPYNALLYETDITWSGDRFSAYKYEKTYNWGTWTEWEIEVTGYVDSAEVMRGDFAYWERVWHTDPDLARYWSTAEGSGSWTSYRE